MTTLDRNERKQEQSFKDNNISDEREKVRFIPHPSEMPDARKILRYPEETHPGVRETQPAYYFKKQGDFTLEDYLAIPDDIRVELIDGVIYDMGAPLTPHQIIAGKIYSVLLSYISGKGGPCIPFIAPTDVQLDCDDKTMVQPDVFVLCDRNKLTRERIVGAPDFIVEVLSKSTRKKDMVIKTGKYRQAGVREYWMIDPDKKTVTVWNFEKNNSVSIYSFRDKVPVGIYDGDCVIDFAPIDDYISELAI